MSETTPDTTEVEEPQTVTTTDDVTTTEEPTVKADDTTVKPDNYHTP
ncbi:MAG: hypothetical protein QOF84_2100 [Streptomyces sp.]|jgi:hypothetical protein|nr:hypothetical protein [Streptomyces sp.]MDX6347310.1 hypothetical protein [Streptomyces sp.]